MKTSWTSWTSRTLDFLDFQDFGLPGLPGRGLNPGLPMDFLLDSGTSRTSRLPGLINYNSRGIPESKPDGH